MYCLFINVGGEICVFTYKTPSGKPGHIAIFFCNTIVIVIITVWVKSILILLMQATFYIIINYSFDTVIVCIYCPEVHQRDCICESQFFNFSHS